MRLPLQEQRILLLVLRSKMRLPLQEQRILHLVLRSKMRLFLQEQRILLCFAEQNATAFAGAEDFTSLFCGAKCDCLCRNRDFTPFCLSKMSAMHAMLNSLHSMCLLETESNAKYIGQDFTPCLYKC